MDNQFIANLNQNLQKLEGQLDTDGENHLVRSDRNARLWCVALHQTFCQTGSIAGALALAASVNLQDV